MQSSFISSIFIVGLGGLAFYFWSKLQEERRKSRSAERTILAQKATIASLLERVQDERSEVTELFLRQPLALD